MSWDCPLCRTENTSGSRQCKGCEAELSEPSDKDTEPDEALSLSEEEIKVLEALSERFTNLLRGKGMHDIVKPEFHISSELFLRAAVERVATQKQDLVTTLLIAVAWGIFIAENGSSKLTMDLTELH